MEIVFAYNKEMTHLNKSNLSIDLTIAIDQEDRELMAKHVKAGASLDQSLAGMGSNRTPLSYAANNENWKSAHMLIDLGANIHKLEGSTQWNALGLFIVHYEKSLFDRVVTQVDINHQDCDGETPLHYAIAHENIEIIRDLLRRGANWDIKDRFELCPREIMETHYNSNMVALVEEHLARQAQNELNQSTPVLQAGKHRPRL